MKIWRFAISCNMCEDLVFISNIVGRTESFCCLIKKQGSLVTEVMGVAFTLAGHATPL